MKRMLLLACKVLFLLVILAPLLAGFRFHPAPPPPKQCALCGDGRSSDSPVLLNLTSGELESLPVSNDQTGVYRLFPLAGAKAVWDECRCCHVFLPQTADHLRQKLYCFNCRSLLTESGLSEYALLDSYDPNCPRVCPIRVGEQYTIRQYTVKIFHAVHNEELELKFTIEE